MAAPLVRCALSAALGQAAARFRLSFAEPCVLSLHAVQAIGLFNGPEGSVAGDAGGSAEGGEGGSGSVGTLGQSLLNRIEGKLGVQQRVQMVGLDEMARVCSNEGKRWLALCCVCRTGGFCLGVQRLWLPQPVPGAIEALVCLLDQPYTTPLPSLQRVARGASRASRSLSVGAAAWASARVNAKSRRGEDRMHLPCISCSSTCGWHWPSAVGSWHCSTRQNMNKQPNQCPPPRPSGQHKVVCWPEKLRMHVPAEREMIHSIKRASVSRLMESMADQLSLAGAVAVVGGGR